MAQSYLQIQRQIEALQRQAEQVRAQEITGVVERIKVAIQHYGIDCSTAWLGRREDRIRHGQSPNNPAWQRRRRRARAKVLGRKWQCLVRAGSATALASRCAQRWKVARGIFDFTDDGGPRCVPPRHRRRRIWQSWRGRASQAASTVTTKEIHGVAWGQSRAGFKDALASGRTAAQLTA